MRNDDDTKDTSQGRPNGGGGAFPDALPAVVLFCAARCEGVPFEVIAARHGLTARTVAGAMAVFANWCLADLEVQGFTSDPHEAVRQMTAELPPERVARIAAEMESAEMIEAVLSAVVRH